MTPPPLDPDSTTRYEAAAAVLYPDPAPGRRLHVCALADLRLGDRTTGRSDDRKPAGWVTAMTVVNTGADLVLFVKVEPDHPHGSWVLIGAPDTPVDAYHRPAVEEVAG